MKTKPVVLCLLTFAFCLSAFAQGTAFTYQGRLNAGANPANGSYDLQFTPYGAASGGSAVAVPLSKSAVGVTNGLFTVTLDFGAGVFTGPARWLAIEVRTNGGVSFTPLVPRQPVTPTPYAVYAPSAGAAATATTAATAQGVSANAVTGAGIASGQVVKSLNGLRDAVALAAGPNVSLATNANTLTISAAGGGASGGWTTTGNAGTTPAANFLGTTDGQPLVINAGSVGINTNEPQATLHVNGTVLATQFAGDGSALTNVSATFATALNVTNGASISGGLAWDDKPDVAWHWSRVFAKAIQGQLWGTNGSHANLIFQGDSMANLKTWMLFASLTNVMPIAAVGLDLVGMDGTGSQGDPGGATITDTNYDHWLNGNLVRLAPGTTARFAPSPSTMLGIPWFSGDRLSVCVLTETNAGTVDVYAQQYGNGSPNFIAGSINAASYERTAAWTHYAVSNFSKWNIVVSNSHPTAVVRLIGAAFADTNRSGLGLYAIRRGGASLFEGTNSNPTVFSNVVASLDGDLICNEWKEGNMPGYVTNWSAALEINYWRWTNALPNMDWLHVGTHNDLNENYDAQNLATWQHCKTHGLGYLDFNRIFKDWATMDKSWMTESGVHGNNLGDLYAGAIGAASLGLPALQNILNVQNLERFRAGLTNDYLRRTNSMDYSARLLEGTRIGEGNIITNAYLVGTNHNAGTVNLAGSVWVPGQMVFPSSSVQPRYYNTTNFFQWLPQDNGVILAFTGTGGTNDNLVRFTKSGSGTATLNFMGTGGAGQKIQATTMLSIESGLNKELWLGDTSNQRHYLHANILYTTVTGTRYKGPHGMAYDWTDSASQSDASAARWTYTNFMFRAHGATHGTTYKPVAAAAFAMPTNTATATPPSAASLGVQGIQLWNSNGTLWATWSLDGSTTGHKQLAP